MESTTARPTLLSAAKNFMRKSAGTAVLAIAPLAAVSVVPETKAQTVFQNIGLLTNTSSGGSITKTFPSGSRFIVQGSGFNNIQSARIGVDGNLVTTSTGPSSLTTTLHFFTTVTGDSIGSSVFVPLAYEFTLSKQAGTIGNVTWSLEAGFSTDGTPMTLGSGTLTTGSQTFTGSANYTTASVVPGDLSADFNVYLVLTYLPSLGDDLFVGMNSASQGVTINSAIPEPSTYAALFGLGAFSLAIMRRSRRVRTT